LHRDRLPMRRTVIAGAWLIGTTVPLLAGMVFIFGCCILPFHGVMHKAMRHAMPLCQVAVALISGDHHQGRDEGQTPVPAREKQEPVKRMATDVPRSLQHAGAGTRDIRTVAADATTYRSFITLGAIRCDRDVGLHLLVSTFLI
jgi:hypothetical protein